ncbi:MAG: hypothetical protein RIG77_18125 [Cyclobacteriaceae bacterium]
MIERNYTLLKKVLDGYNRLARSPKRPTRSDYSSQILSEIAGNELIGENICENKSFFVGRIGSAELNAIVNFLEINQFKNSNYLLNSIQLIRGMRSHWTLDTAHMISVNAGVFPADNETLTDFASHYLECIRDLDILGVWFNYAENIIHKEYCPTASLVPLKSLEPYYFNKPWSVHLKGKKVLIIHPFEKSLKLQLNILSKLFADNNVLPKADYTTLKAVQSLGYSTVQFNDWFEALESMQNEVVKRDFDIAIIGAGAYGLPLGAFIKGLGKQAIHLGGATQILFGVKGHRWDKHKQISKLYNEQWIYPLPEERPQGAELVENACYW